METVWSDHRIVLRRESLFNTGVGKLVSKIAIYCSVPFGQGIQNHLSIVTDLYFCMISSS